MAKQDLKYIYSPVASWHQCDSSCHRDGSWISILPACPFFKKFIKEKYKIPVLIGMHPIPEKYLKVHKELESWNAPKWAETLKNLLTDETTRLLYD